MTSPEIKTSYVLIIDKDRNRVLHALFNAVKDNPALAAEISVFLMKERLLETFIGIIKEFSAKMHDLNWCNDPDCKYKKNENQ
jgi:hypothetical protein